MADDKAISQETHKINQSVLLSTLKYGIHIVSGLAFSVFLARLFGAQTIGVFAFLMTFVGVFNIITNLGEQGGLIRVLNKYTPEKSEAGMLFFTFLGFSFVFTFLLGIPAVFIAKNLIINVYNQDLFKPFLILMTSYLLFNNTSAILNCVYSAYQRIGYSLIAEFFVFVAKMSALFGCYYFLGKNIQAVVITQVVTDLALCVGLSFFIGKIINLKFKITKKLIQKAKKDFKEAFVFGIKLLPKNANFLITEYTDRALIPLYLSNMALGLYYIAYQIFAKVIGISSIFTRMIYPSFSRLAYENKTQEIQTIYKDMLIKMFVLITLIASIICGFSHSILSIFGDEFITASSVLCILMLGLIIEVFSILPSTLLMAINKPFAVSSISFIVAIINLILNLVLIPEIGLEGAAIANVTALFVGAIFYNIAVLKYSDIKILSLKEGKKLIIIGLLGSILYIAGINSDKSLLMGLILAPIFALIYAGAINFTGTLKFDINSIRKLVSF